MRHRRRDEKKGPFDSAEAKLADGNATRGFQSFVLQGQLLVSPSLASLELLLLSSNAQTQDGCWRPGCRSRWDREHSGPGEAESWTSRDRN